jgi:hypothetical protein
MGSAEVCVCVVGAAGGAACGAGSGAGVTDAAGVVGAGAGGAGGVLAAGGVAEVCAVPLTPFGDALAEPPSWSDCDWAKLAANNDTNTDKQGAISLRIVLNPLSSQGQWPAETPEVVECARL